MQRKQRCKKLGITKFENLIEKEDFQKSIKSVFKNKWHEKRAYGKFVPKIPEICAAQEKALRENSTQNKTHKTS